MSHFSRRTMFRAAAGAALIPVVGGMVHPAVAQDYQADGYAVMAADERFTTWVRLIDAGGLQSFARQPTPYTVFAVTDKAFRKFPGIVRDLLGYQQQSGSHNDALAFPDTSKIVKFVRSHVVAGKHDANEMMGKKTTVTTVAGTKLIVDATSTPVKITWISVATGKSLTAIVPDMPLIATNAAIYPIDAIGPTR